MNLTPYQKKQLKIVLTLIIGIPLTLFAAYQGVQYLSRASIEGVPKDVLVTNISTSSAVVTWYTDKPTEGFVVPLLNDEEQSPVRDKRGGGNRYSHYVELKGLEPSTTYSFIILSDGNKYTGEDGENFIINTAPVTADRPVPNPVHGSITGVSGDDVIIFVLLGNKSAFPVSNIVPTGGNWIVDLSSFRKIGDKELVKVTNDTDLVVIAKNRVGRGAILEGKYSDLFETDGRLNKTMQLILEDTDDLITYFPDESNLNKTTSPSPSPSPPPRGGETVLPPYTGGEDDDYYIPPYNDGTYTIRHDLRWIDMVTGDAHTNLDSGENTVMITNLSDTSFSVVWRTSSKVDGYIKYGKSKTSLLEESWDIRDGLTSRNTYYAHTVTTNRLDPDTTYYFEIYSGTEKYNNNGNMYSVKTLPLLSSPPPFETRTGTIKNSTNLGDWVVVARIVDDDDMGTSGVSNYLSSMPDDNGEWILTVGDARSEDGSSYFSFSNSDKLEIFLLGNSKKVSDFRMSNNNIELDINTLIDSTKINTVKLLSDYGIANIK
jgi:hypothetical protein